MMGVGSSGKERRTERLTLRRVRAGDWRAVQGIWADEAQSAYACYDCPSDLEDEAVRERIALWASCAESEEHIFTAVCLGETVIGYAALHQRGEGYEIGYCFHSAYHRRGYARESIAALLEERKKKGAAWVMAGTALKNTPSVRLLASLGFVLTGRELVSFYQDENGKDIFFEGGIFTWTGNT